MKRACRLDPKHVQAFNEMSMVVLMLIESIGATGEASVIVSLHEMGSMFVMRL